MAIGCTTLQRIGQVSDGISAKFKISYSTVLEECLSKNDIESALTLLLLGLHSLFDPNGLSPCVITSLLGRLVMALGLSRQPSATQGLSLSQIEMQNRLFGSIYTFDRMVSTSIGIPFRINDEDISVPLPGVTLEEYATPERQYYTMTLQVNRHIIALRQLEEQILQKIHLANTHSTSSLSQADRHVIIQRLRMQIENWYSQGCLITPMERDQVPFHNTISWLNYRYQNLLLLLYTPSHFNSPISASHLQELQHCTQKYIQLSTVLFQHRHLPLNWITLYRFVALCPILLYCLVHSDTGVHNAKDQVSMCADVLEAFPERWIDAKRSALVFRHLASITSSSPSSSKPFCLLPNSREFIPNKIQVPTEPTLSEIKLEVAELVRDIMGGSSAYHHSINAAAELITEITDQSLED